MGLRQVIGGLRLLPGMLDQIAREVQRSKAKDDDRGPRIIEDYGEVHAEAADDPLVQQTWDETRLLQHEVKELIGCLEAGPFASNGDGRREVEPLGAAVKDR
jgi:hypothetical protein